MFEMGIVLSVLFVAIVLFVSEKVRVDVVALGVVVSLMLSGVLSTSEALAGFSNSAVVTIAALFVIGGAVLNTGLADLIGRNILHIAGKDERTLPLVLMAAAALMSSFMSDTGTVAVLLPVVIILARNAEIAPSKLLLPMAYGALLGGAMTLIGTPPNIIVSEVLQESGAEPFSFFSYTPVGMTLLLITLGIFYLFGQKLLPNRVSKRLESPLADPLRVVNEYHLQADMGRLRVRQGSPLIGRAINQTDFRDAYDIDLLKIMRPSVPRADLSLFRGVNGSNGKPKATPIVVENGTRIGLDDVLIVMGEPEQIAQAAIAHQLAVQPLKPKDKKALVGREVGVAEVVIPRRSRLVGKTVEQADFNRLHGLNVLCLFRPNHGQINDVRDLPLRFGDILIVHGTWDNLLTLKQSLKDYIVLGQPEAMVKPPAYKQAWIAALILVGMVVGMVGEWLPLTQMALVAAGAMVLTRCITMDDAYRAIDWKSLMLIAGMIPMSTALANVGLVDVIATGLVQALGQNSPLVMLGGLFILTTLFTQFLSNTATVVVIAPIALTAANSMGVNPQPFLMGVAVAGSMAFASPVASPVNTLVMGAGNYRFSDYMKAGIPLILLSLLTVLLIVPFLYPF